eukprot:TRINITY_DN12879_c0_g1_i1.p1 TRINITY_DN12879_c0_g1~~TRINITY_DN12879_c0_g1_i1.p1  ORF type:complete len:249 (-),score=62.81 TRINITY_DN12879_c0_g1_i1:79-825(-)
MEAVWDYRPPIVEQSPTARSERIGSLHSKSEEERERILVGLFDGYDKDSNGVLDAEEIESVLEDVAAAWCGAADRGALKLQTSGEWKRMTPEEREGSRKELRDIKRGFSTPAMMQRCKDMLDASADGKVDLPEFKALLSSYFNTDKADEFEQRLRSPPPLVFAKPKQRAKPNPVSGSPAEEEEAARVVVGSQSSERRINVELDPTEDQNHMSESCADPEGRQQVAPPPVPKRGRGGCCGKSDTGCSVQ